MQTWPSPSLSYRIAGKLSSMLSTIRTFFFAPRLMRSADIHLLLQSPAQKKAQATARQPQIEGGKAQKVLIVVPFRDKWELSEQCLRSLEAQERGDHEFLVALVDNGSKEAATLAGVEALCQKKLSQLRYRRLRYDTPFNFSALNNRAVRDCEDFEPDVIFLCNNDIEFLEKNSLQKLVAFARDQDNAGAIGCTLIYPNHKIQHLFVYLGSKIVGSHPHKGRSLKLSEAWYQEPRPVGAVTGAVTLVKTKHFKRVKGLDEALPASYQDVDFCLKLQGIGLVNWVLPDVVMIHHETQTRDRATNWDDVPYLYRKWGSKLTANDFVHGSLNKRSEHYLLRLGICTTK